MKKQVRVKRVSTGVADLYRLVREDDGKFSGSYVWTGEFCDGPVRFVVSDRGLVRWTNNKVGLSVLVEKGILERVDSYMGFENTDAYRFVAN